MLETPLEVLRTFSDGQCLPVGTLAENKSGVFFQYHADYLQHHSTLSPFKLAATTQLQKAPAQPHYGLHGVFSDSLPDGWGLYLMDRVLRNKGYNPAKVSALERLAFVGSNCLGALSYAPQKHLAEPLSQDVEVVRLGREAVKEFEGSETDLIDYLHTAGGSGGARPKLNATLLADGNYSTRLDAVGTPVIIKLTSDTFALKREESRVEYLYLDMARRAGIEVPVHTLFDAGSADYWLQQTRFDCSKRGRFHVISAAGLLDASFREPALDYVDLIKATRLLCGVSEAQSMLKRGLFNFLTVNQDDHAKNFSFLADDEDSWRLSPAYDLVYSPSPFAEHMTSFNGKGRGPNKKALEEMAAQAGFSSLKPVREMIEQLILVVSQFAEHAAGVGLKKGTRQLIAADIAEKTDTLSAECR
ncbi:MAG: type II toxin-antitoxin system HipA family toxin [Pseudomonadota bacterium]